MNFRFYLPAAFFISIVSVFSSCSLHREVAELNTQADDFWLNEKYDSVLLYNQKIIDYHMQNDMPVHPHIYKRLGIAAFKTGDTLQAIDYLGNITHTTQEDKRVYYILAVGNRKIDNLSREITALENYTTHFPEGKHIKQIEIRLFQTYVESRNFEEAQTLWGKHKAEARKSEKLLSDYFILVRSIEADTAQVKEIAEELLTLNPKHIAALEFLANHYFWRAENRYQEEMKAYEQNRTHRQYAQLLRAFEVLNQDFRKSLAFYKTLYGIEEKSSYAKSIGNIYLRFDNRSKANYYHSKAD